MIFTFYDVGHFLCANVLLDADQADHQPQKSENSEPLIYYRALRALAT